MTIDASFLTPMSAMLGALLGGGASLMAAIYTHRSQDRLQRVAAEVTKRETVYGDFVMYASNLLLRAHPRRARTWRRRATPRRPHQPNAVRCAGKCGRHSGGRAQGHRRDFAEAKRGVATAGDRGADQEPRSRSAPEVQSGLQGGLRQLASHHGVKMQP